MTPAFLYFPPISASLGTDSWALAVYDWIAARLAKLARDVSLVFLVHPRYCRRDLRRFLDTRAELVTVIEYEAPSCLGAIDDAATAAFDECDSVVLLSLESTLAPPSCAETLLEHHRKSSSWLTTCCALPGTPVVISRALLELAVSLERLLAQANPFASTYHLLRHCVLVCQRSASADASLMELEPSILGLEPAGIPETVSLSQPAGLARLKALTHSFSLETVGEPDLLSGWKEIRIKEARASRWGSVAQPTISRDTPRVLLVSNSSAFSGAEGSLVGALGALPPSRYEVSAVLAGEGHFADALRRIGVRVHITDGDFAAATVENACVLSRVFEIAGPQIVHINSFSGTAVVALARLWGARLIYHVRTAMFSGLSDILLHCDHVLAVSQYTRQRLLSLDCDPGRISVLHDGVDCDYWHPVSADERAAAKRTLGVKDDQIVVLTVGRFTPNKRQDLLISTVAHLPDPSRVRLVLVGEALVDLSWEAYITDLLRQSGVGRYTVRLGFQSDIRQVEAAGDIAVLCSENEPLGTFILESMAMGLPVVVGEDGGLKELVQECGVVIPTNDVEVVAAALWSLVNSEERRRGLGTNAREVCLRHCDVRSVGAALDRLYARLLGE